LPFAALLAALALLLIDPRATAAGFLFIIIFLAAVLPGLAGLMG
jgi:hypothetical protein